MLIIDCQPQRYEDVRILRYSDTEILRFCNSTALFRFSVGCFVNNDHRHYDHDYDEGHLSDLSAVLQFCSDSDAVIDIEMHNLQSLQLVFRFCLSRTLREYLRKLAQILFRIIRKYLNNLLGVNNNEN